jgi:hypothetical protein
MQTNNINSRRWSKVARQRRRIGGQRARPRLELARGGATWTWRRESASSKLQRPARTLTLEAAQEPVALFLGVGLSKPLHRMCADLVDWNRSHGSETRGRGGKRWEKSSRLAMAGELENRGPSQRHLLGGGGLHGGSGGPPPRGNMGRRGFIVDA